MGAKRTAAREPGPLVHPDRSDLAVAGLEADPREAGVAGHALAPGEQRVGDAAAACGESDVHPLDFGELGELGDARAADGSTVDARDEELDGWLKDRVEGEPVTLLRRILGGEAGLEIGDQAANVVGRRRRALDDQIHVRPSGSSMCRRAVQVLPDISPARAANYTPLKTKPAQKYGCS